MRLRFHRRLSAIVIACACSNVTGCRSRERADQAEALRAANESVEAPASPASREAESGSPGNSVARMGHIQGMVMGQLQAEAKSRPVATPSVEDVATAFNKAGIKMRAPEQGLGATLGASYCAGSTTQKGIALSICEFASETSAKQGMKLADERFKAIPDRALYRRASTVLSVRRVVTSSDTETEAKRMAEVFGSL